MWLEARAIVPFTQGDAPAWVNDWLARRRTGAGKAAAPTAKSAASAAKDINAAQIPDQVEPEDPKAVERKEAAAAKRAATVQQAILEALDALEQWIGDQLRQGISSFISDATGRCRRIAARLVDGKAQALSGRVDDLPSRLLAVPVGDRPRTAVIELSKLVLLARAFRADPTNPEIRRLIATSETRDTVLADPQTLHVTGMWEVLAEVMETRRDGLISQTVWLLHLDGDTPRFAMLLDYFPASMGKRQASFTQGERFIGELAFYPGKSPLRALLITRENIVKDIAWPQLPDSLPKQLTAPLLEQPWAQTYPVLLPAGRIAHDSSGKSWWRASDNSLTLQLHQETPTGGLLCGAELTSTAALWSGVQLQILVAQTQDWGRVNG
jgi:hypothetical protein